MNNNGLYNGLEDGLNNNPSISLEDGLKNGAFFSDNSYSPEMINVIDSAAINNINIPSRKQLLAIDEFLIHLVSTGVRDRLDELHLFRTNAGYDFGRINLINPEYVLTHNGLNHSFENNLGYVSEASGVHFNGSFNNSTEAKAKYKLGDVSYGGVFEDWTGATNSCSFALDSLGVNEIYNRERVYRHYMQQGGGYTQVTYLPNLLVVFGELRTFCRTVSTKQIYKGSSLIVSGGIGYTGTGSSFTSSNVNYSFNWIYADTNNKVVWSIVYKGGHMTHEQVSNLNFAWERLKTKIA